MGWWLKMLMALNLHWSKNTEIPEDDDSSKLSGSSILHWKRGCFIFFPFNVSHYTFQTYTFHYTLPLKHFIIIFKYVHLVTSPLSIFTYSSFVDFIKAFLLYISLLNYYHVCYYNLYFSLHYLNMHISLYLSIYASHYTPQKMCIILHLSPLHIISFVQLCISLCHFIYAFYYTLSFIHIIALTP